MIITIAGSAGSGKSTIAKEVAFKLNYKHHSTGDFMRDMAQERKMTLLELSALAEKDQSIDDELDRRQIDLGIEEDDFVIDGRLSFHFIPDSVKVFLDADLDVRAKRVLGDRIRREHNVDLDSTKDKMMKREDSERKRFKEYYHIDPYDKNHFDLVIDTSDKTPEEIVDEVLEFSKVFKEGLRK